MALKNIATKPKRHHKEMLAIIGGFLFPIAIILLNFNIKVEENEIKSLMNIYLTLGGIFFALSSPMIQSTFGEKYQYSSLRYVVDIHRRNEFVCKLKTLERERYYSFSYFSYLVLIRLFMLCDLHKIFKIELETLNLFYFWISSGLFFAGLFAASEISRQHIEGMMKQLRGKKK